MHAAAILQELGFSENEVAVYLALLQLGPSTVLAVARRTGLKRPTLYLLLDSLIGKGSIVLAPQEKRKLFLALPPERLREELERKMSAVDGILPELTALYRSQTAKPSFQMFESKEGILNAYREILSVAKGEVFSFFSIEAVEEELKESFDIFLRLIKDKKVPVREIIYVRNKKKDYAYIQKTRNLPGYKARFTDSENKFFTDAVMYNNRIAIFSFKKRFAVVVESEDIVGSFRSLFELAWLSARSDP